MDLGTSEIHFVFVCSFSPRACEVFWGSVKLLDHVGSVRHRRCQWMKISTSGFQEATLRGCKRDTRLGSTEVASTRLGSVECIYFGGFRRFSVNSMRVWSLSCGHDEDLFPPTTHWDCFTVRSSSGPCPKPHTAAESSPSR